MSFLRYPNYKDSGVEWLGEVPEHWRRTRTKNVVEFTTGWTPPTSDSASYEGNNLWANISDLGPKWIFDTAKRISDGAVVVSRIKPSPKGSLLFSFKLSVGQVSFAGCDMFTNEAIATFRQSPVLSLAFAYYALPLFLLQNASTNIYGARLLNQELIGSAAFPLPPIDEQEFIAAFLDRETSKIDALVAEQQRLIEQLKEKRQAVISHAVTKGLNPHARMKESNIEWLGAVPEHWSVTKMKWIAKMESGHTPDKKIPEYWENGDIPWVSLNDTGYLKDNDYISDTAYTVTELGIANSSAHLLPPRVVVFSRDATIGRCAITTRPMAVSQHFIAWVCGEFMIPEFLLLRLRSMTRELDRLTTGATLKTIGMPEVRTLVTPVPPVREQHAIIDWVSNETARIDALTNEAQRAIDLLRERRTALISAAVTGQIDVRTLTPEQHV